MLLSVPKLFHLRMAFRLSHENSGDMTFVSRMDQISCRNLMESLGDDDDHPAPPKPPWQCAGTLSRQVTCPSNPRQLASMLVREASYLQAQARAFDGVRVG